MQPDYVQGGFLAGRPDLCQRAITVAALGKHPFCDSTRHFAISARYAESASPRPLTKMPQNDEVQPGLHDEVLQQPLNGHVEVRPSPPLPVPPAGKP